MSISHPLKQGVIAVSTAIALLAAATPSQAGVVGSFDPQFGGTNPALANVGFQGTFDLNVANSCYGQANPYVSTGNGCTITVNSITVGFYNYSDYGNSGATSPTLIQSYTLDASTGTFAVPLEENYVTGAYFDPTTDRLVSFDTVDSNPFAVSFNQCPAGTSCGSSNPISYNGSMILYFVSGYLNQIEGVQSINAAAAPSVTGSAYLVDCNTRVSGSTQTCNSTNYDNSNGAGVRVTSDPGPLPEPETIPLALIGLGALALTGWRRRHPSASRAG